MGTCFTLLKCVSTKKSPALLRLETGWDFLSLYGWGVSSGFAELALYHIFAAG